MNDISASDLSHSALDVANAMVKSGRVHNDDEAEVKEALAECYGPPGDVLANHVFGMMVNHVVKLVGEIIQVHNGDDPYYAIKWVPHAHRFSTCGGCELRTYYNVEG